MTGSLNGSPTDPNPPLSGGTEEAARALAGALGESADKIQLLDPQWARYSQEGAVVEVKIGRYRAEVQMTPEDLGFTAPAQEAWESLGDYRKRAREARQTFLRVAKPGQRFLLPARIRERARQIEDRARQQLRNRSFRTHWGFWVPQIGYDAWKAEYERYRAEYLTLAEQIFVSYADLVSEVASDYAGFGGLIYGRLAADGRFSTDQAFWDDRSAHRQRWISDFVARMIGRIPSAEEIRDSFTFEDVVYLLPLASQMATDRAEANRVTLEAEERARIQALDRMSQDIILSAARKNADDMQTFIGQTKGQIAEVVLEATTACLKAIRKNRGNLPRNSSVQLRNLVEKFGSLVFWTDPELQARVAEINRLVQLDSRKKGRGEALSVVLSDLRSEARDTLLALDYGDSRQVRESDEAIELAEVEVEQVVEREVRDDLDLDALGLPEPINLGTERLVR